MSYSDVTTAIADALAANTSISNTFATPPATLIVDSAIVSPAPTWGTFDGGSFCDAEINWELILVTPHADYGAAFSWIFTVLPEVQDAFPDPTLGGLVDGCMVSNWSQPQQVQLGGEVGIAVYVALAPMRIN